MKRPYVIFVLFMVGMLLSPIISVVAGFEVTTSSSRDSITVHWEEIHTQDFNEYRIYVQRWDTHTTVPPVTININSTTSWTVTGLRSSTLYQVWVTAEWENPLTGHTMTLTSDHVLTMTKEALSTDDWGDYPIWIAIIGLFIFQLSILAVLLHQKWNKEEENEFLNPPANSYQNERPPPRT